MRTSILPIINFSVLELTPCELDTVTILVFAWNTWEVRYLVYLPLALAQSYPTLPDSALFLSKSRDCLGQQAPPFAHLLGRALGRHPEMSSQKVHTLVGKRCHH